MLLLPFMRTTLTAFTEQLMGRMVYVLQRYRLLLALAIALLLTPVLGPQLPSLPASTARLAALIGGEVMVGVFQGTIARILLSALDVAGTMVSLQLGLSAAQIFNPMLAQQGALTSAFYGVLLIFVTELHHLLLRAVVDSYNVFIPGTLPQLGDLSEAVVRGAAGAFRLGGARSTSHSLGAGGDRIADRAS